MFCREGQQEGARKGFNPRRKGRNSHHPLLAVLAEAQFILHGWLRSGNTGRRAGSCRFCRRRWRCCRRERGCAPCGPTAVSLTEASWISWRSGVAVCGGGAPDHDPQTKCAGIQAMDAH